jgi:hypothetical protein
LGTTLRLSNIVFDRSKPGADLSTLALAIAICVKSKNADGPLKYVNIGEKLFEVPGVLILVTSRIGIFHSVPK